MDRVWVVASAVGASLAAGCATYGGHLSASPTAAGEYEWALSADAIIVDRGVGPQVLPNPEVALRRGLGRSLDVGGRLNVGGFEANARWRVLASPSLDVALVPALGFGFVPATNADTGLFNANTLGAALGGFHIGRTDLVVGLRGGVTYSFPATAFRGDAAGAKVSYLPGGALGVRLPIGRSTYLFPDVNVFIPYDSSRDEWSFPIVQGGVSLQFE